VAETRYTLECDTLGASDARADPTRRAIVWVVLDPVHQEYMASVPGRGWMGTRDRAHAHEFASAVEAELARKVYWSHRASAMAGRTARYYTVADD
jgi:hypothetical protein